MATVDAVPSRGYQILATCAYLVVGQVTGKPILYVHRATARLNASSHP